MNPDQAAPAWQTTIDDLREFIAALDRRVPALERTGETEIARDAEALRDKAVKRIAILDPTRGH